MQLTKILYSKISTKGPFPLVSAVLHSVIFDLKEQICLNNNGKWPLEGVAGDIIMDHTFLL